jgi:hypothetical protein
MYAHTSPNIQLPEVMIDAEQHHALPAQQAVTQKFCPQFTTRRPCSRHSAARCAMSRTSILTLCNADAISSSCPRYF